MIHYDTEGYSAVDTTDINANGIPDFIDSVAYYADYAYHFEVEVLGFQAPLPDSSDDPLHYDVYVQQIGASPGVSFNGNPYQGYYGFTPQVDSHPMICDSKKIVSSGFLVIDNNFAITDSVLYNGKKLRVFSDTGVNALRITLAHEFQHMIQFGYNATLSPLTVYNELTSVWMEHRVFPETRDYLQYLRGMMNTPENYYLTNMSNLAQSGYANAFFFQYLQEHSDSQAPLHSWQILGNCSTFSLEQQADPYVALDSALRMNGRTLPGEWAKFMNVVYHTGYRATDVQICLSNASDMPMLRNDNGIDIAFSEPYSYALSLMPFQVKLFRCVFATDAEHAQDTMDLIMTNTGGDYLRTLSNNQVSPTIIVSTHQQDGYKRIGATNYFYTVVDTDANTYDTLFLSNGFALEQLDKPYPQPFSIATDKILHFPVSSTVPTDAKVRLSVSSVDGVPLYSADVNVVADATTRTRYVAWTATPTSLQSGVYIYSLGYQDNNYVGTILVKQ